MSFNIIPTPPFEKELKQLAKKYPSVKNDMKDLASNLMQDPKMGTPHHSAMIAIRSGWLFPQKGKANPVGQE